MASADVWLDEYDGTKFDVAASLWLKEALTGNGLTELWDKIERGMHRVAHRVVIVD